MIYQGMPESNAIQQMIAKAIHLPDCPVKKAHAIASRAWLEKQFNAYIEKVKAELNQPNLNDGN